VPVPEVSTLDSTRRAREEYLEQQANQRPLLG
jgi:3D-(3,5/4)-trihydroxycyclohexane-1,2-dione acylhydrolase (decyclizing)